MFPCPPHGARLSWLMKFAKALFLKIRSMCERPGAVAECYLSACFFLSSVFQEWQCWFTCTLHSGKCWPKKYNLACRFDSSHSADWDNPAGGSSRGRNLTSLWLSSVGLQMALHDTSISWLQVAQMAGWSPVFVKKYVKESEEEKSNIVYWLGNSFVHLHHISTLG